MKLRPTLMAFAKAVADAAERDSEFAAKLDELFGNEQPRHKRPEPAHGRPKNRRPAALLDPVEVIRKGEVILRDQLAKLSLEELRDVVADYGMDPGKLVMKWKDSNRVIDRIVEIAAARSQKGDAFRGD
ncbi:hypothetical protein EN828_25460 [Mesorhizobium sp. M2D.F.Ca.ET.185.01.1.1]|uniref:hypothetical protein n=1 Tax=unclassified Mesorhizobium TaxID=325217 RepID=UPI000FC9D663|nr:MULTISPECIES: hypothetical protein [unclassified Mesorhizobium]TGU12780.1 hypothetical protein EN806_15455 [bacterium M00.F.Ca.ET.163.01.1.1]TGU43713.1 hypothetical protein EN789_26405 [bacterium M00.F.Ca.ET.146.01.1.1]TGV76469.1 hypothetical protein EN792_052295 [Mesorhizobium sp. M00.F.Ca.ET.149.01.1.1]TGW09344.1 hypothetical protein EN788_25895 [Mesorhizobium sp. M2D.F.Ca.ET.145.01.1.1]TGP31536.1 hypothetical protein EN875_021815 [Mesorhizobium sp. M2D.F.Ca.ET.232.01.1.1]